jgi:hypothetical protein
MYANNKYFCQNKRAHKKNLNKKIEKYKNHGKIKKNSKKFRALKLIPKKKKSRFIFEF